MARSDWPVEQRIVPAAGERLLDLDKIRALSDARRSSERQDEPGDPLSLLVDKYAREILGDGAVMDDDPARRETRMDEIAKRADAEAAPLARTVARAQHAAVSRLSMRSEEEQLWGVLGRRERNSSDARDL